MKISITLSIPGYNGCVEASNAIGTLNETSLHASLKDLYTRPGDRLEAEVNGYVVDIVRGDELIEFQTRNFASIKAKLDALSKDFLINLVYPIPSTKWIVRIDHKGEKISRRKSPKRGKWFEIFNELVYIPHICRNENFSLEAALVEVEETWQDDGKGSWRRKGWSIFDRQLIGLKSTKTFHSLKDYAGLFPDSMPSIFTNAVVSSHLKIRPRLAQKMTYCLRHMGAIEMVGKDGRAHQYKIVV